VSSSPVIGGERSRRPSEENVQEDPERQREQALGDPLWTVDWTVRNPTVLPGRSPTRSPEGEPPTNDHHHGHTGGCASFQATGLTSVTHDTDDATDTVRNRPPDGSLASAWL
jgi:hypothetical protein